VWVGRLKNGLSVEQPIAGDELRAIKRYLAARTDSLPWLFLSERGQPLTRQTVNYILGTAATHAGLPAARPRMLRHSCGYYLANRGYDLRLIQDCLGHIGTRSAPSITRARPPAASRGSGAEPWPKRTASRSLGLVGRPIRDAMTRFCNAVSARRVGLAWHPRRYPGPPSSSRLATYLNAATPGDGLRNERLRSCFCSGISSHT
jgi:hypothetical protein